MHFKTGSLQQIKGHNLYVEIHGPTAGPVVLLLHHGLGSTKAWRLHVPALAGSGFRTIVYDRWGYGKSDPRPGLSIPDFNDDREDLHSLMDNFQVETAALVGHSDGGTIALHFAAAYPQRVTRLVSVAAHVYVEPRMRTGIEGVQEIYGTGGRLREGLQRAHGKKAGAVFEAWFSGWRRPENLSWDMRPILGKIACPVLVVQGSEDEYATPQHARDIAAAIPKAGLWLEPGAGHMLPMEKPELFNRRMVEFLRRDS